MIKYDKNIYNATFNSIMIPAVLINEWQSNNRDKMSDL